MKKIAPFFWSIKKMRYICSAFRKISRLGYGVMVTLQILVLSFMVRVRVAQQSTERLNSVPFFFYALFAVLAFGRWMCAESLAHIYLLARA